MQVWIYSAAVIAAIVLYSGSVEGYKVASAGYRQYIGKAMVGEPIINLSGTIDQCKRECNNRAECVAFSSMRTANKYNNKGRPCALMGPPKCTTLYTCKNPATGASATSVTHLMSRNASSTVHVKKSWDFTKAVRPPGKAVQGSQVPTPAPTPAAASPNVRGYGPRPNATFGVTAVCASGMSMVGQEFLFDCKYMKKFYYGDRNLDLGPVWSKTITALKVPSNIVVHLYKGKNHTGDVLTLAGPVRVPNIGIAFGVEWNDAISSMNIVEADESSQIWKDARDAMLKRGQFD